jgi:hypothetical protein
MLSLLIFFLLVVSTDGTECKVRFELDTSSASTTSYASEIDVQVDDHEVCCDTWTGSWLTKEYTVDCEQGGLMQFWDSWGDTWDGRKVKVYDVSNDLPIAGIPEEGVEPDWRSNTFHSWYSISFPGANGKRGCMNSTACNYVADAVVPSTCIFTGALPNTNCDGTCKEGYGIGGPQVIDQNTLHISTVYREQGWNYPITTAENRLTQDECQKYREFYNLDYSSWSTSYKSYYTPGCYQYSSNAYVSGQYVKKYTAQWNSKAYTGTSADAGSLTSYNYMKDIVLKTCVPIKDGCTDMDKSEYDPDSTNDVLCDTSGSTSRCTDPTSITYNPGAFISVPSDCVSSGGVSCSGIQNYLETELTSCIIDVDPTSKKLEDLSCGELKTEFNQESRNCDCA